MEKNIVLSVHSLKKNYGSIQALKGISFEVPKGCVYGILGPNGSGKTTLLGIVLDVLKSNGGSYEWTGYPKTEDARKHIGALLETPNFYHYLNAVDNLKIVAEIKQIENPDIDGVLERVSLLERKHSKFNTYSLGMKQRLAIASALLSNPDVIVFDEPTNGLDPEGIAEIRNLIKELSQEGRTIIMASHLLDEVEKVCTHVAIMKKGVLLSEGSVHTILKDEPTYELKADDMLALKECLKTRSTLNEMIEADGLIITSFTEKVSATAINKFCFEQGVILTHLKENNHSLEKTFLELIK
jgi:ABC-type multidrug transport system ATPase subunit